MGWWIAMGVMAILVGFGYFVVFTDGAYLGRRAVRAIYQGMAPAWTYATSREQQANDREHILRHFPALNPSSVVLDISTGTGRIPVLVAGTCRIVGLDISPKMLARAAENVGDAKGVLLVEGDACWLPVRSGMVDLVTCIESFHHFPRPRRALAEMNRVLSPGGTLVLSKLGEGPARLIPGKAMTRSQFTRALSKLGFTSIQFHPMSPVRGRTKSSDELLVAQKPPVNSVASGA